MFHRLRHKFDQHQLNLQKFYPRLNNIFLKYSKEKLINFSNNSYSSWHIDNSRFPDSEYLFHLRFSLCYLNLYNIQAYMLLLHLHLCQLQCILPNFFIWKVLQDLITSSYYFLCSNLLHSSWFLLWTVRSLLTSYIYICIW